MVYTLRFFSSKCSLFHNSDVFGSCTIHILCTGCDKIKKSNSGAKRLINDRAQRRITVGRTPPDEWSARRRDLYLTTHNTHNRHPCPRRDSNLQSQEASGRRTTPQTARSLGPTIRMFWDLKKILDFHESPLCKNVDFWSKISGSSNETPTWCNTVQVLFLQGHSTCFGHKRPSSGVFKTSTAATGTCVIVAGKSSHLLIRAGRL